MTITYFMIGWWVILSFESLSFKTILQATLPILWLSIWIQLVLLLWAHRFDIVEVIAIERINQAILHVLLIIDAILNNRIRYVINRLWDSLKLNFPQLYRLQQQSIKTSLKLPLLPQILRKHQLIHLIFYRINSIQIILNIHMYLRYILIYCSKFIIHVSYLLFCTLSFI